MTTEDAKAYREVVGLLHTLMYVLTDSFLKNPHHREGIKRELSKFTKEMSRRYGSQQLCYDKEKGWVPCNDYAGTLSAISASAGIPNP